MNSPEPDEISPTPEEELRVQQEREFTQYLSYHYDIAVCVELCQVYKDRAGEWEDTDDLRIALVQNVVIAYCRPFMRSRDKLGGHSLPEEFAEYEDSDLRLLHHHLMDVRSQSVAHSDARMRSTGFEQQLLRRRDGQLDAAIVSFGAEWTVSHRMMGPIRSMLEDLYARLTDEVHQRQSMLYDTRATVRHSIGRHFMVIDVPELFGEEPPPTKGMNAAVRAAGGFKPVD